jgi:putative nucleotidyltransferase with HDIG domain
MTPALEAKITERVSRIEATPAIHAVFLPLLEMLNAPPNQVKLDKVIELVSYDNAIAAQCLRVANSPLFGMTKSPESIRGAVISLGLRRVETILLTCCLAQGLPVRNWIIGPEVFWRHSLGVAMVCQKLGERTHLVERELAYMAGLLHDIGLLVNCMIFPEEFSKAMELAVRKEIPLNEAESETMGFTHMDTGRLLAEKWNLGAGVVQVIACHHAPDLSAKEFQPLVAMVYFSDLLCRMRGLGYRYYEGRRVDLADNPAWDVFLRESREMEGMDLARFTFELDESIEEICQLVTTIFGQKPMAARA